MGEVIENKVVQLAFDNTKFEKGVQATLNILGRLNNAMTGLNTIKYSILGVADQVKAVTFDPINTQLQIGVGKAMALTAALTGVYNISDQIYHTITSAIRSMTFDQVANGFSRYESVVNSTQTILAAARKDGEAIEKTMDRVTAVQDRLLWFADETSYDAQAMLSVISQFTSHGIELEDAATAMEGIANWAATAGANASSATIAMQQLAQTLGKGSVQRQDWMSITTQNMDTSKFKELVIDAAIARGELKKVGNDIQTLDGKLQVNVGNIEQSLSKNWFTKDVLMDVLTKYGEANAIIKKVQDENPGMLASEAVEKVKNDAQYAEYMLAIEAFEMAQVARTWTDAFESVQTATATKISEIFKTIFGDYLEAKDLWTDVAEKLYDIFVTPLDTVMQAFQKWSDPDGMKGSKRFWESIWKIFTAIEDTVSTVWTLISKTFGIIADEKDDIDDATQRVEGWVDLIADILNKATTKFEQFAQNIKMFFTNIRNNERLMKNIESFLNGLKIGFDLLKQFVGTFIERALIPLFNKTKTGAEEFSGLGKSFEVLMVDIQSLVDKTDAFNKVFDTTSFILGKIIDGVTNIFSEIEKVFNKISEKSNTNGGAGGFFTELSKNVSAAEGPLEKIGVIFGKVIDSLSYGISHLVPLTENIVSIVGMIFGGIGKVFLSLQPAFKTVGDTIKYIFDTIVGALSVSGGDIGGTFKQIGSGIATLITDVNSGNVENFKKFLEVIHNEVAFYKDLLFGGMTIPEFLNECSAALLNLCAGITFITSALTDFVVEIALMSKIIELIQEFQWDGILGSLLWGDSFTNITDQLYYKALAQTFAAVADGILMIAAALFVISLVDPKRMQSSLDTLKSIAGIMLQLIVFVEIIGTIFDKLSQWGNVAKEKKGGILGYFGGLLGFDTNAFVTTAKYAGMAVMINTITSSFIKIAISMLLIATIAEDEHKLKLVKGTIIMIAGTVTAMLVAIGAILMLSNNRRLGMSPGAGSKDFLLMAASIWLITSGILKMAKALAKLAEIPEDNLAAAGSALGQMMIALTVFMFFAATFGKSEANFIKIGRMVSLMGLTLIAIAGAFNIMANIKDIQTFPNKAKWLCIAFGAIAATVGILIASTAKMDPTKAAIFTTLSGLFMAVSVSVLALAGALVLVANVADPNNIEKAASCLGIIFVAFAALIGASAFIKPSQVMGVATALALMNISTLALVPLLNTVMKIDDGAMEKLKKIFIGLGIAMGAFMIVAAIIAKNPEASPFIGYLFAIIGALAAISAVGLMISAGILMISAAFSLFANSLKEIQDLDGERVKENILTIGSAIPELMVNAFATFMAYPFEYKVFVTNVLTGLMDAIGVLWPKFITFIQKAIPSLLEALKELWPKFLDFLNEFGAILTEKVVSGTIKITFAIFEGLINGWDEIAPKIPELINKFADSLDANLDNILKALERLLDPIAKLVEFHLQLLITVIQNSSGTIRTLFKSLFKLLLDLVNDFGVIITEKVTSGTIRIIFAIFSGLVAGFAEAAAETIPKLMEICGQAVIDILNGIADVLDEQSDEIIEAINHLMTSIGDFIYKLFLSWGSDGGLFFEGGSQIIAGITRGISSKLKPLGEYVSFLGLIVKTSFAKVLEINSPSKVFEAFGKFIPEGLLNGLSEMKDKVYERFGEFAGGIAEHFGISLGEGGLAETVENLLGGMLGGLNVDIIPNLDLSNLNGQLGDLTNLFGEQQLQGMVGLDGFNTSSITNGTDSVSLVNSMDSIDEKLSQLITIEKFNVDKPTDVNITMQGDTNKFFKAIRNENTKRIRTTGYNALSGIKA